jgi:DnaJ-class molecular chaperone
MDPNKDYYSILGVDKSTEAAEIKKKYRNLAKKYHPDKHKGDEKNAEKFKEISEAYDILGDKGKREQYDMQRDNPFFKFNKNSGAGSQDFSGFRQQDANSDGFGDIFSSFFGGGASRGRQRTRQEPREEKIVNAEETIRVPIRLAFSGGEYLFKTPKGNTVKLKIPKDCQRFHKIKLKEQGKNSEDLIVTIDFSTNSDAIIENYNVIQKLKIPVWDALLGTKKDVVLYNDKKVSITIKEGTNSHHRLKLSGMGLKSKDSHGDCFLEIVLETPSSLNQEQKDILMSMRYNTI